MFLFVKYDIYLTHITMPTGNFIISHSNSCGTWYVAALILIAFINLEVKQSLPELLLNFNKEFV